MLSCSMHTCYPACSGRRCPCRSLWVPLCFCWESRCDCSGDLWQPAKIFLKDTSNQWPSPHIHHLSDNSPKHSEGLSDDCSPTWAVILVGGNWGWLEETHPEALLEPEYQDFLFFVRDLLQGQMLFLSGEWTKWSRSLRKGFLWRGGGGGGQQWGEGQSSFLYLEQVDDQWTTITQVIHNLEVADVMIHWVGQLDQRDYYHILIDFNNTDIAHLFPLLCICFFTLWSGNSYKSVYL